MASDDPSLFSDKQDGDEVGVVDLEDLGSPETETDETGMPPEMVTPSQAVALKKVRFVLCRSRTYAHFLFPSLTFHTLF